MRKSTIGKDTAMAGNAVQDLFARAREQYLGVSRWAPLMLLGVLIFHLSIFAPFYDLKRQQKDQAAAAEGIARAGTLLPELHEALDTARTAITGPMGEHLAQLVKNLRSDMWRLDMTWQMYLLGPGGARAGSPFSPPPIREDSRESDARESPIQAQHPHDPQAPRSTDESGPFEIEDPALVDVLRQTEDVHELRVKIRPFVEERIIAPRFEQLNAAWRDSVLPQATPAIDRALALIADLRAATTAGQEQSKALAAELARLKEALAGTTFGPPGDPFWWTSVEGKFGASLMIADKLARTMAEPDTLTKLAGDLSKAAKDSEALREKIAAELQKLEEAAKDYQVKLAALMKPADFLPADLERIAKLFPVLLAALIAFVLIWRGGRLREMAFSLRLLSKHEDAADLWTWLKDRPHFLAKALTPRERPLQAFYVEAVLFAGLGIVWVAVALWQVISSGMDLIGPAAVNVVLAVGLVAGGFAARMLVVQSILRLLPDDTGTPG